MNSGDLKLKLAREVNRLNQERAVLEALNEQWKDKTELVHILSGAVQTLNQLANEAAAEEAEGLKQAAALEAAQKAEKESAAKAENVTPISEAKPAEAAQ